MPQADLTLEDVSKALYCLDNESLKRFLRGVLDVHWQKSDVVPLPELLRIVLDDWLAHLGVLTDAQRYEVNKQIAAQVESFAKELGPGLETGQLPVFRLVLSDYRWVSCDGRQTFFDVEELVEVDEIPHEAVTYITCDLTAAYLRLRGRVGRLKQMPRGMEAHESHPENSS